MKPKLDIIAVSVFAVLVGLFFYQTIFYGRLPVPADTLVGLYHPWRDFYANQYPRGVPFKNFLITDPVRQQIPWRKVTIDQWRTGTIPWWNPYSFSGTPLAANIQAAVFYPLNILFFLFDFKIAWTLLIILQPILAGIFFYWYARSRNISPVASLFGAIAWSFSGFMVAWMTWGTIDHTALWLPLLLLSIDKLLANKSPRVLWGSSIKWLVVFVAALSFQFFAGHSQVSLYITILAGVYALWRIKALSNDGKQIIFLKQNILFLLGGLVAAAIITALQWTAILEFFQQTTRVTGSLDYLKPGWLMPWYHLAQFFAPDFFGNPATLNYWGEWNYGEFIGYIGVVPFLFALFAMFSNKIRETIFWSTVVIISLSLMITHPFTTWLYRLGLPLVSTLQPTRLMVLVDFSLGLLSALGLDHWIKNKTRTPWHMPVIIGVLYLLLWGLVVVATKIITDPELHINWLVSQKNLLLPTLLFMTVALVFLAKNKVKFLERGVLPILFGILIFDLFRFGWKFTPFTPQAYFFPLTASIKYLQVQQKPFRILSLDKRLFPPNVSAYYGIESIDGYDPLYDKRYEAFIASVARQSPDILPPYGFNRMLQVESVDSAILPLLNVRYVLSLEDVHRAFLKKVFQEGDTRIYEYTKGTPRAYLVEKSTVILRKSSIIETLHKISDYQKEAIVEKPIELVDIPLAVQEGVEITDYSDQQIKLNVYTSVKRLLVIANLYSPFWKAFIDGKITEIHRTNYIFQGIVVPAGEHSIELKVQPL